MTDSNFILERKKKNTASTETIILSDDEFGEKCSERDIILKFLHKQWFKSFIYSLQNLLKPIQNKNQLHLINFTNKWRNQKKESTTNKKLNLYDFVRSIMMRAKIVFLFSLFFLNNANRVIINEMLILLMYTMDTVDKDKRSNANKCLCEFSYIQNIRLWAHENS